MPVLPDPGIIARKKLRKFLEDQLTMIEKGVASPEAKALEHPFHQVLEGLLALDYGETQTIFAARKKKKGAKDGSKPYTLLRLRMQANGYVDLLIAQKYKGPDAAAVGTVAEAYGTNADTLRQWRKGANKNADPVMKSFRQKIANSPWVEDQVLEALKKTGAKYVREKKLAYKSKK